MIEINPELLRRILDGDQDAQEEARAMLPKEGNLFGRWATHEIYGRVLCVSSRPVSDGDVFVAYLNDQFFNGVRETWVPHDSLTFDPVELVTEQDFHNAPEDTIVVTGDSYPRMKYDDDWSHELATSSAFAMAKTGPWQVVRWGEGERA